MHDLVTPKGDALDRVCRATRCGYHRLATFGLAHLNFARYRRRLLTVTSVAILAPLVAACAAEERDLGRYQLHLYAGEAGEQGLPAAAFVDGWSLHLTEVLVEIEDVVVRGEPGEALVTNVSRIYDLAAPTAGTGQLVVDTLLPVGTYNELDFRSQSSQQALSAQVKHERVQAMIAAGARLWVSGTASQAGRTLTFSWPFAWPVHATACGQSAVVNTQAPAAVRLDVHVEQLFAADLMRSLAAPLQGLRFEALAKADGNGDSVIAPEELAAVPLTTLPDYPIGPRTDLITLWDFVNVQAQAVAVAPAQPCVLLAAAPLPANGVASALAAGEDADDR